MSPCSAGSWPFMSAAVLRPRPHVRSTINRMDTGDLRKRILRALEEARKDSSDRRRTMDEAAEAYERFLTEIAAPLIRQAVTVLRAEGQTFDAHTPAGSVRLAKDGAPQS